MKLKAIKILAAILVVAAVPLGSALAAPPSLGQSLALGDSLAVGVGATDPDENGYVSVFNHDVFPQSHRGPEVVTNLAVSGDTSGSFISGGQLANAVAAIADPRTNVKVVTLDIGGNDLLGLLGGPCAVSPADPACQAAILAALTAFPGNYTAILSSLTIALAEDPANERFLVMTYYNPFDGTGSPFEPAIDAALLGVDGVVDCSALGNPANAGLNDLIACIGASFGVTVVDVYPLFDNNALALTHIASGDIHPNDAGHHVIADAFVQAMQE